MSTFNKVILEGFLGQDPQTATFDDGGQITNFSLATTEHWKDKQSGEKRELTEWSRIVTRNKMAELAEKYLKKGSKVLIEGKLRTRKWTDKDKIERYTTEIHASNMIFMSSAKKENEGSAVDQHQSKAKDAFPDANNESEPDDLPF